MGSERLHLRSLLNMLLCLATVATASVMFCGCGNSNRIEVNGTVTLNGKPLEKGYVTFRPQSSTTSPSAGAKITDGEFSVDSERGLLPGKFRVEITASRPASKKVFDRFSGKMVALEEQYIPAKYNTNTQLELTISSDAGKVTKDFDLPIERC